MLLLGIFLNDLFDTERQLLTIQENLNGTPITLTYKEGATGKLVVIAHGFAGSSVFMQPIAMSLANAGYVTVRLDFFGHGKNKIPFFGDIRQTDGTTNQFIFQLNSSI